MDEVEEHPKAVRMRKRVELFVSRGLDQDAAQEVAEGLVRRDAEHDDRRMCIECAGLNKNGRCVPAKSGQIVGASTQLYPVKTILMRCERFTWQTPE